MKHSIALFSDAAKRAAPEKKGSRKTKTAGIKKKKKTATKKKASRLIRPAASKKIKTKKAVAVKKVAQKKVSSLVKAPKIKAVQSAQTKKETTVPRGNSPKKVAAAATPKAEGILIGKIAYYFTKANACAFRVENAEMKEGATIRIQGEKTNFKMTVKSIQINRIPVPSGKPGEDVGIGVTKPVAVGDSIYLL